MIQKEEEEEEEEVKEVQEEIELELTELEEDEEEINVEGYANHLIEADMDVIESEIEDHIQIQIKNFVKDELVFKSEKKDHNMGISFLFFSFLLLFLSFFFPTPFI